MKHLIVTEDLSSLGIVDYDRIILDTTTNEIVYMNGVKYEYVDLGLSVKWAKCNVGAKTETDYGSYFMWGSTKANTPDECTWATAPFNNGASDYNSSYFYSVKDTVCPNGVLAKEYDAASQIMGSDWRMPTKNELKELIDNTNSVWVPNYNNSGINGRKFTSKINGNSIFIPAAGSCGGGSVFSVGSYGLVWSSSLDTLDPNGAWYLDFGSGNCRINYRDRCNGRSVRGVRK